MSKDVPAQEARAEVARAVSGRMGQLGITGVAISAVLEWPWDYLVNILNGSADGTATVTSPLETQLAKLADGLAAIDALRQDVAVLADIVHDIDGKIEVVTGSRRSSGDRSPPE
ncbi:MAG: hypothetical protein ABSA53_13770 [Streptosporangiaceae bacterium]